MHQRQWDEVAERINFNLNIDFTGFRNRVPLDAKILDFGCGYGRVSKQLYDCGYTNIVGVESSKKMIERGRREFPELNIEFTDGETLSYENNHFEAVVVCALFTCITNQRIRESCIKELFRVLKPDGLVHMIEFCAEESQRFESSIGVPMLYSTLEEWRDLIGSFSVISEKIIDTKTMSGSKAKSYRLFASKPLTPV